MNKAYLEKIVSKMPGVFSDIAILVIVGIWVILIFGVVMSGGCKNTRQDNAWEVIRGGVIHAPRL